MKDVNILKNNGINVDKSLELFGDMATYDDMLETFLNEIDEKLANLTKYKEVADMANYAILVHSLKSDAKYFGFDKLAELAYQHELESKANHIYYVYDKFDELMNEARGIVSIVREYFGEQPIREMVDFNPNIIKDKTILVVDDSDVISTFVKKVFDEEYEVLIARDGKQAMDMILESNVVAMLLDLNMPNVDGFAVLEYFKNNDLFKRIPVAIITGVGNDAIVNQVLNYPIKQVLRKPFNERDVKQVVEAMLN